MCVDREIYSCLSVSLSVCLGLLTQYFSADLLESYNAVLKLYAGVFLAWRVMKATYPHCVHDKHQTALLKGQ